jgi:hypothetical protein
MQIKYTFLEISLLHLRICSHFGRYSDGIPALTLAKSYFDELSEAFAISG